jgi:hypothetical protein
VPASAVEGSAFLASSLIVMYVFTAKFRKRAISTPPREELTMPKVRTTRRNVNVQGKGNQSIRTKVDKRPDVDLPPQVAKLERILISITGSIGVEATREIAFHILDNIPK